MTALWWAVCTNLTATTVQQSEITVAQERVLNALDQPVSHCDRCHLGRMGALGTRPSFGSGISHHPSGNAHSQSRWRVHYWHHDCARRPAQHPCGDALAPDNW